RRPEFFRFALYVEDRNGVQRQVDIPDDALLYIERNWLVLNLRSDWTIAEQSHKARSLLVINIDALIAGSRDFTVMFEPTPTCFLQHFAAAGNTVAFKVLDNVHSRIMLARHHDGAWRVEPVPGLPGAQTVDFYRLVEDDIDWLGEGEHEGETFV